MADLSLPLLRMSDCMSMQLLRANVNFPMFGPLRKVDKSKSGKEYLQVKYVFIPHYSKPNDLCTLSCPSTDIHHTSTQYITDTIHAHYLPHWSPSPLPLQWNMEIGHRAARTLYFGRAPVPLGSPVQTSYLRWHAWQRTRPPAGADPTCLIALLASWLVDGWVVG